VGRYKSIQDVKELWRQEPEDNAVFKAATEDIEEYPPEIQAAVAEGLKEGKNVGRDNK